ncbi:unnamed protein product, partial [Laminaria digitata]
MYPCVTSRVNGAVGLLSACLATLLLSHLSVVLCGRSSARNKQTLQTKSQTNPPTNNDNDNSGHSSLQKESKLRAKVSTVRSPGGSDVTAEESTAVRGGWRRQRQVSMSS